MSPKQLFPGVVSSRGINTENTAILEGVTSKDTDLHFRAVSASVTS